MSLFLRWSFRAYRCLVFLYPAELRRDFGPEMIEAFMQDLSIGCAAQSLRGAARVWRTTLRELILVGLPSWMQIPAFAVPAIASAIAIVTESPLLILTSQRETQMSLRSGDATSRDALAAIAIAGTVTALTSFVAVYRWRRGGLIALDIGRPDIGPLGMG